VQRGGKRGPITHWLEVRDEKIGIKVTAELKRTRIQIAKKEGRSLAQLCEILLAGAGGYYKEEGPAYLQRLLSRQKKDSTD
jgi:hypothetical protein